MSSKPQPVIMNETPRLKSRLKQDEPQDNTAHEDRIEKLLNRRGWRTVNGRARYLGFEHELNLEITTVLTAVRK